MKTMKKITRKNLYLVIPACISCTHAFAQTVSIAADRDKILIGEQVILQLRVDGFNKNTHFVEKWFLFADTAQHLQLVKSAPVDTVEVNGGTVYTQTLTITSFDSGRWEPAPLFITVREKSTGITKQISGGSFSLTVVPVDVSELQQYHDIKNIIPVENETDYWQYIAGAVSLCILAFLIWQFFKRKKSVATPVMQIIYKPSLLEEAISELKKLDVNTPAPKIFFTKIISVCRHYFDKQLHIKSSQTTSDELMILLSPYFQQQEKKASFYQLLRMADAAKFAKYKTPVSENEHAVKDAIESLRYIDAQVKTKQAHA